MAKIWQVVAEFDDWDSNMFVNVGFFSRKTAAESVRKKWEKVFEMARVSLESPPENWDPRQDEYYRHPYYLVDDVEYGLPGTYKFDWRESKLYHDLLEKYEYVKFFAGIKVHDFEVDRDMMLVENSGPVRGALRKMLASLEREYKLGEICEHPEKK